MQNFENSFLELLIRYHNLVGVVLKRRRLSTILWLHYPFLQPCCVLSEIGIKPPKMTLFFLKCRRSVSTDRLGFYRDRRRILPPSPLKYCNVKKDGCQVDGYFHHHFHSDFEIFQLNFFALPPHNTREIHQV